MQYALKVYPERCTGCRLCELACSFYCEGEFNPTKSRVRIIKDEERGLDVPILCLHCEKPMCEIVCPVGAITRDEETGAVLINSEKCFGCKICLVVCPLGALFIHPLRRTMTKCDLCNGTPRCVELCEPGAIEYAKIDRLTPGFFMRKRIVEKIQKIMGEMGRT